jgi:hypothetical protein
MSDEKAAVVEAVTRITVTEIKPGDLVVLRTAEPLTPEGVRMVGEFFRSRFPTATLLTLNAGDDLSVVRLDAAMARNLARQLLPHITDLAAIQAAS